MDEQRQIRFLVSPTLFVASLLWGAWVDPNFHDILKGYIFGKENIDHFLGIIAGGGLVIFVSGYVIGTITYIFLRFFFKIYWNGLGVIPFHEAPLCLRDLEKVLSRTTKKSISEYDTETIGLSAVVAFDHGILKRDWEGIHLWLVRRWSAFSIASTSAVGLVLSVVLGHRVANIMLLPEWEWPVLVFVIMLVIHARFAWHDVLNMIGFALNLPDVPKGEA